MYNIKRKEKEDTSKSHSVNVFLSYWFENFSNQFFLIVHRCSI